MHLVTDCRKHRNWNGICLLYTSDAADEKQRGEGAPRREKKKKKKTKDRKKQKTEKKINGPKWQRQADKETEVRGQD